MTTSAFLDMVLLDILEVGSTDGNYSAHRARALRRTQQALEYFEMAMDSDADWKKVLAATVTLSSGSSSAAMPSDFLSLDHDSLVWIQNDVPLLGPKDLNVIMGLRREKRGSKGKPQFFGIGGQDSSTFKPKMQFDCIADASYTVEFDYLRSTPTLVDQTDSTNLLSKIPDEHVRSVLYPGVQELLGRDGGDGRTVPELGPAFKAAVAQVKAHRVQKRPDDMRIGEFGPRTFESW